MKQPDYSLEKIKFGVDGETFKKAVGLYESGKVTSVAEGIRSFTATVIGTKPYHVFVEARQFDLGDCTCYLGQNDTLCKHMVALAIYVAKNGRPLSMDEKKIIENPICSGQLGSLTEKKLSATKKMITDALRYVKSYNGPSRIWFAYQDSLSEGCRRLSAIVSGLPVGVQTTEVLVDLLLRLDKKISGSGVDDSDGTVGDFMVETVDVLKEYAKLDAECIKAFDKLKNRNTSFGWEETLINKHV